MIYHCMKFYQDRGLFKYYHTTKNTPKFQKPDFGEKESKKGKFKGKGKKNQRAKPPWAVRITRARARAKMRLRMIPHWGEIMTRERGKSSLRTIAPRPVAITRAAMDYTP